MACAGGRPDFAPPPQSCEAGPGGSAVEQCHGARGLRPVTAGQPPGGGSPVDLPEGDVEVWKERVDEAGNRIREEWLDAAGNHHALAAQLDTPPLCNVSDPFLEQKKAELQQWRQLGVYDEVDGRGKKKIGVKWVLTEKQLDEGLTKKKARLVVKGYQDTTVNRANVSSPTCGKEAWRVLVSLCVQKGWVPVKMDVTGAFLQSDPFDRPVLLRPPPEAGLGRDVAWQLKKAAYGLADAPREWFVTLQRKLLSLGASNHPLERCLFKWMKDGELWGVMSVHVDDLFIGGQPDFEAEVMEHVRKLFPIGREEKGSFVYCGVKVESILDQQGSLLEIRLDQNEYVKTILEVPDGEGQTLETFQSRVGALLWVAGQTRPDLGFQSALLARASKCPGPQDWTRLNATIKRMHRTPVQLRFLQGKVSELTGFSDAAFANLEKGTMGGGIVFWKSEQGETAHPLAWHSRKIRRVVKSTFAGEVMSMVEMVDVVWCLRELIHWLGAEASIQLKTDCKSLLDHLQVPKGVTEKRLLLDLAVIQECVEDGAQVEWIPTGDMLADALTKAMVPVKLLHSLHTGRIS